MRRLTSLLCAMAAGLVLSLGPVWAQSQVDKVEDEAGQSIKEGIEAQRKVDEVAEDRAALIAQYRTALAEAEALRRYNARLGDLIANRERALEEIAQVRLDFEATRRTVPPLLDDMIEALDQFIRLDLPFQRRTRLEKVEDLRNLMVQRDVPLSQKYRRILEAYDTERSYGQGLATYAGEIKEGTRIIPVDFLRVGRLGLYVQSRDNRISRTYDLASQNWIDVPQSYRSDIADAIAMAKQERPQDLLRLPVTAARIKADGEGRAQ